jgi:hypothetical protein
VPAASETQIRVIDYENVCCVTPLACDLRPPTVVTVMGPVVTGTKHGWRQTTKIPQRRPPLLVRPLPGQSAIDFLSDRVLTACLLFFTPLPVHERFARRRTARFVIILTTRADTVAARMPMGGASN